MADDLSYRIRQAVQSALSDADPAVKVVAARRPDDKLDITVISSAFESLPAEDRERLLWSILRPFPAEDLVQMTYSLLITPSEAAALAADPLDPAGIEDARKDSD
jgi:hypothetical protein